MGQLLHNSKGILRKSQFTMLAFSALFGKMNFPELAHFVKVVYISCCFGLFSTLAPDAICTACGYQASDGRWVKPMWTGGSSAQTYYPSYNLAPTTFRFHL